MRLRWPGKKQVEVKSLPGFCNARTPVRRRNASMRVPNGPFEDHVCGRKHCDGKHICRGCGWQWS